MGDPFGWMDAMDDEEEIRHFVADRWHRLVRSAVFLGCSHSEAQDIAQSTLERCLVKWRHVQRADDPDAYVHRILVNTIAGSRRRRWTAELPTAEPPDNSGEDVTCRVDDTDAVTRALQRLPAGQRTVVVLRYYSHLTEQQMSTALGTPRGTIKSRLSRGLKALATDPSLTDLRDPR